MTQSDQNHPRLLVVEDEEEARIALRLYLSALGFKVDCAQEREEAEALIANFRFSMVITDLRLTDSHGAEGLEIISYVRETSPGTRIVVLTAYGTRAVEEEARRRGADALLYKPIPLAVLARLICVHLALPRDARASS